MKSRITKTSLAVLPLMFVLATPLSAMAQSASGPYVGLGLGWNKLKTVDIDAITTPFGPAPGGNLKANDGSVASASIGWAFSNGVRLELDNSYRRNSFHEGSGGALRNADAYGRENKTSWFLNALYQFNKTSFGVAPYVGVGVGQTKVKWRDIVIENASETARLSDTQTDLSYQAILGVSFLDNLFPGFSLTAEYRYMRIDGGRDFAGRIERSRFGAFPITSEAGKSENHAVIVGVRYQF